MQKALWQNQTANRGQDIDWGLGQMQNQLGWGGLANQANIANQQNALGYAGLGNQYNIAKMGDDTARYQSDQQFELGKGNLNLARDVNSWNQSQDIWRNQFDTNVHNDNYNLAEMRTLQGFMSPPPPTGPVQGTPISGGSTDTTIGIG
jgi:hypothetical protein